MKIAIPMKGESLDQHFGHCEKFALIDMDADSRTLRGVQQVPAPAHEHGLLPKWLQEQGVEVVIAGGMGGHAHALLESLGVTVVTGAPSETPETLVRGYLAGTLISVERACTHTCSH